MKKIVAIILFVYTIQSTQNIQVVHSAAESCHINGVLVTSDNSENAFVHCAMAKESANNDAIIIQYLSVIMNNLNISKNITDSLPDIMSSASPTSSPDALIYIFVIFGLVCLISFVVARF